MVSAALLVQLVDVHRRAPRLTEPVRTAMTAVPATARLMCPARIDQHMAPVGRRHRRPAIAGPDNGGGHPLGQGLAGGEAFLFGLGVPGHALVAASRMETCWVT